MGTIKTISVKQLCTHYEIPISFIESLSDFNLIELSPINNVMHVPEKELATIEKLMRLHYDLDINFEGLDVVVNLLNQINNLQNEVNTLNNELCFYKTL